MEEIYIDIRGYEGFYQVSNYGNVVSLKSEKILKQPKNTYGYSQVGLYKNGKCKIYLVSRLVAMAFPDICGKWFEGCCVEHKNTDKNDNRAINLRVCTQIENNNNPITKQKQRETRKIIAPKKKVVQKTIDGNYVKEYDSLTEAAEDNNLNRQNICACCRNKQKSAGGFVWEYKD